MQTPDEFVGRTVAGRFRITRFLGEGGMAQVYVAEQEAEPREIALKIMNKDLMSDRSFVKRFQREAKAASSVRHPNSVHILEYGVENGLSYLAMELLDGEDLFTLLAREGPIGQKRAVRILAEVADALSAAHELGIVHRDLKPENIMILKDPGSKNGERVKVLDFGIAKLIAPEELSRKDPRVEENSAVTNVGTFIGTPAYMSPEQCALLPIDTRADIYTCGVLLFQLVTGKVPFWGETPLHTATKHIHEPPPKPSSVAPAIARALEAVILKALAKKPGERYQTAKELGAALREVLPLTSELPAVRPASKTKTAPGVAPPVPGIKVDPTGAPKPPAAKPAKPAAPTNGSAAVKSTADEPIESARTVVGTGEGAKPAAVVVRDEKSAPARASDQEQSATSEVPTPQKERAKEPEKTASPGKARQDSISEVITQNNAPQSDPEDRARTLVREPPRNGPDGRASSPGPPPPQPAEAARVAARRTGGEGARLGPQGTEVMQLSKEEIAALSGSGAKPQAPPKAEPSPPPARGNPPPPRGAANPTLLSAKPKNEPSPAKAVEVDELSVDVALEDDAPHAVDTPTPAGPSHESVERPEIGLRASDPMRDDAGPAEARPRPKEDLPRVVVAERAPPPPTLPMVNAQQTTLGAAPAPPPAPEPPLIPQATGSQPRTLELKHQRPAILEPFPLAQPARAMSPQRGLLLGFGAGIAVALAFAVLYFFVLSPR